ncbi:MAG: SDR family NAD(P)-dependent oxidoreductase [Chloroflexota bacterium]|nr:SDR family NAD(P)-dependent oxidoreductase [Chloroflexota bacterium]
MKGKVALIVGGTSGIGRACALQLAQRGYNIMIVGRNQEAGDSVVATVERAGVRGRFIRGDVSLMQEVRRIAAEIGQQTAAIHLLIHCTDVILNKRIETAEGVELSFATNFLSRFLINELLLPLLKAGAPARIVHVAAPGLPIKINLANLPPPPNLSSFSGHNIGQGANNLYSIEMAARLEGNGVSIVVMNPGMVDTDIRRRSSDMPAIFKAVGWLVETLFKSMTTTSEQCAEIVLRVALSPETADWNGKLVSRTGKLLKTHAHDTDPARRHELWQRSERAISVIEPSNPLFAVA